ncbi:hypothetical protein SAMN04489761_3027 [Tenacibaculum sp. MAR_2009_124]|uniref:hypothetical protein n=1 Tax=Tenacibaculum sp. MAR_2009_124 TaxID=1250059 RepID=UPI00089652E5|nr:hypothetical protein [Tenacibaculum sp. MAR_2009_124]SEC45066.1 hypothetical protein SAMN04489761_3027 [Tenacibaculum sp. MAR_2009_124]
MLEAIETISKGLDLYPDTTGLEITDINAVTLHFTDPVSEKPCSQRFETNEHGVLAGVQLINWMEESLPMKKLN